MSIYIKDMEKPENCYACPCYNDEYGKCQIEGNWEKGYVYDATPDWCPLISVPPHGRLGDLDALPGQMQHNLFEIEDKAEKGLGFDETLRRGMQYGHAVCVDAVNDAPTIIPADKEG